MDLIHWPSVAIGAAMCACMIYAVYIIVATLRRWVGHHEPLDSEPTPDTVPVAALIESARKIVRQGGDCNTPVWVDCRQCPAHRLTPCTKNWGDGDCVPWFKEYLASQGVTP